MDKRFTPIPIAQQLELRRQAIDDVERGSSDSDWDPLQDIEQERSEGSVQTMNRILAMLGLKLGVVRIVRTPDSPAGPHNDAS